MALELVAQGNGSNTHLLQDVANRTEGSGVIEFEVDTEINIPGPNIKLGPAIRLGLKALEVALKAVPGVHLDHGIQFTDRNGRGTIRIVIRNNPIPLVLGAAVLVILPWLIKLGVLLLGFIIAWKLFKGEVKGAGTFLFFGVVLVIATVLAFMAANKGGGLELKPPGLG